MPEHGRLFLVAGDMNAGRRGPQDRVKAKATGLTPGEPDLRVYVHGGRLKMIEFKTRAGRLSSAQRERHGELARLGFEVVVVQAATEDEAADATERLVRAWLAANDNQESERNEDAA
ncbi:VRR-NUC domain-containing protein [Kaustia mangrovi]|uniref:VRR-NUC domain-containing protein n=1 Tax=Kaustia mangrovi TaxID=2593653 RepID=A0A7S8C5C9_9HYPH|nr:VRR-NUC domain-containing protein [Kaustia mangrovi]QPC43504.1 VRR-NUC domain-containing protein [Kaustia mangrovi]